LLLKFQKLVNNLRRIAAKYKVVILQAITPGKLRIFGNVPAHFFDKTGRAL
jgi:hypothetical protein